ncbi:MAG: hypothetical protein ACLSHG_03595 [Oscillospiraceae bacterium]
MRFTARRFGCASSTARRRSARCWLSRSPARRRMRSCAAAPISAITFARRSANARRVLGPAPLPVVRMNNRYRYRVTLYCNQSKAVARGGEHRHVLQYRKIIPRCHRFCR